MKSDHGHIFEQMRKESIADALAFYNMGDLGTGETVHVHGHIMSNHESVIRCEIFKGGKSQQCEFLRSAVTLHRTSSVTSLIEIPIAYVSIFRLAHFVADERELDRRRRDVEMFNAPYLPPMTERPLERVGGIRI
jgi:hypothetical protein